MEDRIRQLEHRIAKLEEEVGELRTRLALRPDGHQPTRGEKAERPIGGAAQRPVPPPFPAEPAIPAAAPKPAAARPRIDFEKQVGQVWLPRVFMVILLIGMLWGFKLGVDYGLITKPVRIGLGYLGTILLGFFGYRQYTRNRLALGLTLLGGMVALGMLATFAANALYALFPASFAFAVNVLIAGTGIGLAHRLKSETLSAFSALGAFLVPFLLESASPNLDLFGGYILLLFLSLFYLSLRSGHKVSFYLIFALFHLTLLAYELHAHRAGDGNLLAGIVLIQHVFLLAVYLKRNLFRKGLSESLLYLNAVLAIVWSAGAAEPAYRCIYAGMAILYAAASYGYRSRKNALVPGVLAAVAVFSAGIFIISLSLFGKVAHELLLLLDGTVGLWVALRTKSVRTAVSSAVIYVPSVLGVFFYRMEKPLSLDTIVWLAALASLCLLYYFAYRYLGESDVLRPSLDGSLVGVQLLFLIFLYRFVGSFYSSTAGYENVSFHSALFVIVLALFACYQLKRRAFGQLVSAAAAIELLLAFIAILPVTLQTGEGVNAAWFAVNLLSEWVFAAVFLRVAQSVWQDAGPPALRFLAGRKPVLALGIQIVLFVLLNKWVLETSRQWEIASDYIYLIHSFTLLLFAFLSISLGRRGGWKGVRNSGIGLVALTILKLITVDLTHVSLVIRAVLFILVGITGVLYSRSFYKK